MSKSLTNFVGLENQIYWENSPRLMTLQRFKEQRGNDSQKWELIEIQDQLDVFCDEVIINNTESLTEEEFAKLLKYAKNKKVSYKDCYQFTYTRKISEGRNTGAERTTGIRIKNLQIGDARHPKYYNYTADVVSYDISQEGNILSRQQLSFFFRLTPGFPEIHWKSWTYKDAYSDVTYDDQCIQHMGPKMLK